MVIISFIMILLGISFFFFMIVFVFKLIFVFFLIWDWSIFLFDKCVILKVFIMCLDIVFLFDFGGFMMRVCIGFDDMFDRCIW